MNTIGGEVIEGMNKAIAIAEKIMPDWLSEVKDKIFQREQILR